MGLTFVPLTGQAPGGRGAGALLSSAFRQTGANLAEILDSGPVSVSSNGTYRGTMDILQTKVGAFGEIPAGAAYKADKLHGVQRHDFPASL
jgi:hypothetical protein